MDPKALPAYLVKLRHGKETQSDRMWLKFESHLKKAAMHCTLTKNPLFYNPDPGTLADLRWYHLSILSGKITTILRIYLNKFKNNFRKVSSEYDYR